MARDVWREHLEEGGYEYHVVAKFPGSDGSDHIETLLTRQEAEDCANAVRSEADFGDPEVLVGVYGSRRTKAMTRYQDHLRDPERVPRGELPATRKQLNYLENTIMERLEEPAKFETMIGKPISELTREEASLWISVISGRAA